MEILKGNVNLNLVINTETDFLMNLGSEENLQQFEGEVLKDIINPIENYEVVRFIHEPYEFQTGLQQCDIWFYFYFLSGTTYVQDYTPVDISYQENELLLKQSTKSFFRLEFYKTPTTITNNTLTCEPPTRLNRKLVFSRDLSLPIGEKYYYPALRGDIHVPVFTGNNYRNKENMYLFWFEDESVLEGTNYLGTTTGNTFFMTAKFYDAKNGSIIDFANDEFSTSHSLNESNDFYYQVDINKINHTYTISKFNGTKGVRIGGVNSGNVNAIKFFEKGGGSIVGPSSTPTPTPTIGSSPTPTPTNSYIPPNGSQTPTPTPTTTPVYYWYELTRCDDGVTICYSVPFSGGASYAGRVFYSSGGHYYTMGRYINTTDTDPGTGSCSNKLDGSVMPIGYTCYDSPETPLPSVAHRTAGVSFFVPTTYKSSSQVLTDVCGKNPSQIFSSGYTSGGGGYVDESSINSGTIYQLYTSNISGDSTKVSGPSAYCGILINGQGSNFAYVAYISSDGIISEWNNC